MQGQKKSKENSQVDMYTATGWVSAATGILCLLLFMPGIFRKVFLHMKSKIRILARDKNSYS